MKHFVYLTEDKLYYIRRAPGRSGGYYFLGFRPVAGLEGVESAMESLSEVYNLKGRKVTVIMGVKVGIHVVNLPASTKSTALQMAEKQLLILGGEEEQLLAADFFPSSQEGMLRGVVYTAPGSWLWAVRSAASRVKLHLKEILPSPAFVASFPDPKEYGMEESPMVLVHLSEDFIGLYEIEDGRCYYWEKLELKPGIFSKMGEECVLMEELQAQILRICRIRKNNDEGFKLGGVLIQNDCLIAPGSCARYLGGLLEVPCEALNHGTLWEKQVRAENLKNLQFSERTDYIDDENLWVRITDAGFPLKPVCISLILFAVIAVSLLTIRFYTHRKLHHLELMYADRQEVYEEEEKNQLEAQLKELEGLVNEMGEISGNAVIDPTLFSSLDNALKPEMELESLEFLAEDGRIRIKILTDDTRDISGFIRIMEENGFIMDQSRWQKQETKVHGEILFKSGKETGHETQ